MIRRAIQSDEAKALEMYDLFIDYTHIPKDDASYEPSTSARTNSGSLYKSVIESNDSALFVAEENEEIIGILEIHKVPRIKKSNFYAELELMFVRKEHHGKGIAQELMNAAIKWAKDEKLDCIRLYSGHELQRAHSFYEKMGFENAGKTYILRF